MHEEGYKVIGLADITGALYNPNGLDIPGVLAYLKENKTVEGYTEAEHIGTAELLELECEILMPAATENQITTHNADRIKCRILAEGANGPTTADADEIISRQEHLRHPGHPGQCRRRDGELLRMGAGPNGVLLERGDGQHPVARDHGQQLQ